MFVLSRFITAITLAMAFLLVSGVFGDEITVDNVTGTWDPGDGVDRLIPGSHSLKILLSCDGWCNPDMYYSVSNAFTLYSPDGASIPNMQGRTLPAFDNLGWFSTLQTHRYKAPGSSVWQEAVAPVDIEPSGQGMCGFMGVAATEFTGLPPYGSVVAWEVDFDVLHQDSGRAICIEKNTSAGWIWQWASNDGSYAFGPWFDLQCWEIEMPPNDRPELTICPNSFLVDFPGVVLYDFDAFDPEGDDIEYIIIEGPGSIDINNGVYSFEPGIDDLNQSYQVMVCASDFVGCGNTCTFSVTVSAGAEDQPHISREFTVYQNGPMPSEECFLLHCPGLPTPSWTISGKPSWLHLSATSGNVEHLLIGMSVATASLPVGEHRATLSVVSNSSETAPQVVDLLLRVLECNDTAPPVLTYPPDGYLLTDPSVELAWIRGTCGAGYVVQYSTSSDFSEHSPETVELSVSFRSSVQLFLPEVANRIYWRVKSIGMENAEYSDVRYFDYLPASTPGVTSVHINSPVNGTLLKYASNLAIRFRLTSTWSGPIHGSILIDDAVYGTFSLNADAMSSIEVAGPGLNTVDVGVHSLRIEVDYPNTVSSGYFQYTVDIPRYGTSDHMQLVLTPSYLPADGNTTSKVTALVLNDQNEIVHTDAGTQVDFSIEGGGSITPTATTSFGSADVTYTAGNTESVVRITASAVLESGLRTAQADITLAPDLTRLLALHDFCRSHLDPLQMDMFSAGFQADLETQYDFTAIDAFVESNIRHGNPVPDDYEAFERLVMAEHTLLLGWRYSITGDGNPFGYISSIGGGQELMHETTQNLVRAALAPFALASVVTKPISSWSGGRWLMEIGSDVILDVGFSVVDIFREGIADEEIKNSLAQAGPMIKEAVDSYIGSENGRVSELLATPMVTSPLTAGLLSIDGVMNISLSDSIGLFAQRHEAGTSIESVRSQLPIVLAALESNSASTLGEITSREATFASSTVLSETDQLLADWDNMSLGDKATTVRDLFMNSLSNFAGTTEAVQSTDAAAVGLSGYIENKRMIKSGVETAFGSTVSESPGLNRDFRVAGSLTSAQASSVIDKRLIDAEQSTNDLFQWIEVTKDLLQSQNDVYLSTTVDSLGAAVQRWQKAQRVVRATVVASYESALASVPNFTAIYSDYKTITVRAQAMQALLLLGAGFWIDYPGNPSQRQDLVSRLGDGQDVLYDYQSTLHNMKMLEFLVPGGPALSITQAEGAIQVKPASTNSITFAVVNHGFGAATDCWVGFRYSQQVEPSGSDSIYVGDLPAGDSVVIEYTFFARDLWLYDAMLDRAFVAISPTGTGAQSCSEVVSVFIASGCCTGRVGDANGSGDDMPTIGDISTMIDAKFIGGSCEGKIGCFAEADINQSAVGEASCDDITIGDISMLIDYLFIAGPENMTLPDCP